MIKKASFFSAKISDESHVLILRKESSGFDLKDDLRVLLRPRSPRGRLLQAEVGLEFDSQPRRRGVRGKSFAQLHRGIPVQHAQSGQCLYQQVPPRCFDTAGKLYRKSEPSERRTPTTNRELDAKIVASRQGYVTRDRVKQ